MRNGNFGIPKVEITCNRSGYGPTMMMFDLDKFGIVYGYVESCVGNIMRNYFIFKRNQLVTVKMQNQRYDQDFFVRYAPMTQDIKTDFGTEKFCLEVCFWDDFNSALCCRSALPNAAVTLWSPPGLLPLRLSQFENTSQPAYFFFARMYFVAKGTYQVL